MEEPGESQRQEAESRTSGSNDKSSYRWLGFGMEFVGVICVFMWLGHLADRKFQTTRPWWLLTGFFVSLIAMVYLLIKETLGLGKRDR